MATNWDRVTNWCVYLMQNKFSWRLWYGWFFQIFSYIVKYWNPNWKKLLVGNIHTCHTCLIMFLKITITNLFDLEYNTDRTLVSLTRVMCRFKFYRYVISLIFINDDVWHLFKYIFETLKFNTVTFLFFFSFISFVSLRLLPARSSSLRALGKLLTNVCLITWLV